MTTDEISLRPVKPDRARADSDQRTVAGRRSGPRVSDRTGNSTLALLCAVSFVVIMDAQIVILALPSIQSGLHFADAGSAQWVLSAYLLCFGGLLLLGGRAGDLFGRRKILLTGTAMFGVTSLACGLATSPAVLVAARALQGVSAAAMAPTALSILAATFTEQAARNRALALWGAVGGIGATGALLIGGTLTSSLGWRWIFLVNVPVAVALLFLAPKLLAESRNANAGRSLDLGGAVTLTGGLFAVLVAIIQAPSSGWAASQTIVLLVVSVVLLAAFAVIERRAENPLLPLELLRSRLLVGGNGAVFAAGMCAWGLGLVTSDYAQKVLGYSALRFGLASLALTVAAVAGARIGQCLLPRLGGHLFAIMAVIMTVGCALLTDLSSDGTYFGDLFGALALFGIGMGTITVIGSVAALHQVESRDHGVASGVNTAAFQLGGAVGTAVVATVLAGDRAGARTDALNEGAVTCVVFGLVALGFSALLVGRAAGAIRAH